MGKFKGDYRGETLTTVYYSEITDTIILIYNREDDTMITVDFEMTRLALSKHQATYMIVKNDYQLIGAFYEN